MVMIGNDDGDDNEGVWEYWVIYHVCDQRHLHSTLLSVSLGLHQSTTHHPDYPIPTFYSSNSPLGLASL